MTRFSRRHVPAVLLTLCVLLAACGVPAERQDRPVSDDEVPFQLLERPSSSLADTLPPPVVIPTVPNASYPLDLYFISDQHLVRSRKTVSDEPDLEAALAALLRGPGADDISSGLRSALGDPGLVLGATLAGGQATVNLGGGFSTLLGAEQLLALGQIVFTVTSIAGVGTVTFALEGTPLPVPRADGQLVAGPISRDDLRELVLTETGAVPPTTTGSLIAPPSPTVSP